MIFCMEKTLICHLFHKKDPRYFWECSEIYERINANLFRTIDFSLPSELTDEENIELLLNLLKNYLEKVMYIH